MGVERVTRVTQNQEVPMSTRHRSRSGGPTSSVPEDRERRKAEHRRVRRNVNQALHLATALDDTDELVLETPHATHGYTDEHTPPAPHASAAPPKRLRHRKQTFWKRRTEQRRQRARLSGA